MSGVAGGGTAAGAAGGAGAAAGAAAAGAGAAAAWHAGVEAETLGWWQNKGYDLSDPKAFATKITEQYREAERHFGVPADRLLKLPEKTDEAGWKALHQKQFGVPADAKDYDFSAVKRADGNPIDQALADTMRATLHARNVPKDAAPEIVKDIVKHLDNSRAAEVADRKAKLDESRANLAKNWGNNAAVNKEIAKQGALRLGWTEEQFNSLETAVGYETFMETMRKIGASTSEATFVEGRPGGPNVTTMEGAKSRLSDLKKDEAWAGRLLKGDAATVREWQQLELQASGIDINAA